MLWKGAAGESRLSSSSISLSDSDMTFRLKGPNYEAATRLQAASGVHHLMSNLWHVLVSIQIRFI